MQAGIIPGMNHGAASTLKDKKYHLEALDPKHRMGDMLEMMYKKFDENLTKQGADAYARKLSVFFAWLDEACHICPDKVREVLGKMPAAMKENFISAGVVYLPAGQRMKHHLDIHSDKLYQENQLFDTTALKTHFSGKGWAIYVVSPSGNWYAGSHIVGEFHHSSFLSGKPVLSAGEMKVENGELKVITAKSGHYKPSKEQFIAGLRDLGAKGMDLEKINVNVYAVGNPAMQQVPANVFLASPDNYTTWG